MQKRIVFDFETGGVLPAHPNIQLAAIAVDEKWNEVDSFNSKIAFDPATCDAEALAMNHYDAKAWDGAPKSDSVASRFGAFLKKNATTRLISKRTGNPYTVAQLAGYNASFDKDRLWAMFAGEFVPASHLVLCVLQRALWYTMEAGLKPENHQLSTIAKMLGIATDGAHDAMADVRMTAAVARKIGELAGNEIAAPTVSSDASLFPGMA